MLQLVLVFLFGILLKLRTELEGSWKRIHDDAYCHIVSVVFWSSVSWRAALLCV